MEYPFYRETLELKSSDAAAPTSALDDSRSFRPHEADAKCDGFHPDYAVEWSVAGPPRQC